MEPCKTAVHMQGTVVVLVYCTYVFFALTVPVQPDGQTPLKHYFFVSFGCGSVIMDIAVYSCRLLWFGPIAIEILLEAIFFAILQLNILTLAGDYVSRWCTENNLSEATVYCLRDKGFRSRAEMDSLRVEDIPRLGLKTIAEECKLREVLIRRLRGSESKCVSVCVRVFVREENNR